MIEISPYEFMAREFERLAILRKMWSADEIAKIVRRYDIERQGERDPTNPFAPRYELRKDADEIERLREALRETIKVMARAHDRIHVLPRTSDTELAQTIELSIKQVRAALGEGK